MAKISKENERAITANHLRSVLSYDPETGIFRWRQTTSPNACNGDVAGCLRPDGRRVIKLGYTRFLASRLAWLFVYGEWPERYVDHIDRDQSNDAIANLRLADGRQNCLNRGVQKNNSLGLRNITKHRKRFVVMFSKDRRRLYRESFLSLEDAIVARDALLPRFCESFTPSHPDTLGGQIG